MKNFTPVDRKNVVLEKSYIFVYNFALILTLKCQIKGGS